MKDLKAIKGTHYIAGLIAEGEHEHQDFKFAITDARKIARSLSAFANNDGGRLLIGVKDNGIIAGVRNEEDIYLIEQAAQMYCRPEQELVFKAFRVAEGATVLTAEISASPARPVQAMDTDGRWKSYYRVADENILATPLMIRAWRRKASGEAMSLNFGEAENAIIELLGKGDSNGLCPEDITAAARVSKRTFEDVITRLYALGVIDFRFVNRRFNIVAI